MEDLDPANMRSPTKSFDEKKSFDDSVSSNWVTSTTNVARSLARRLVVWGVETRSIHPVAIEDKTETHFIKIFFIWVSANTNILSFASGTLGPVTFELGLRDSCLVILFFNLVCAIPAAYFTTWGPRLGLRQLCTSRYTFGYYGAMVPCLLTIILDAGFAILNSIVGGQALSSVGKFSWTVGIVIILLISLFVSFCGMRVLNWYENCAWILPFVVFVVVAGVGGKHFVNTPAPAPATAAQIFSFGATIAGYTLAWSTLSSDYTVYFHPRVSSWRIFIYSYLGLNIPTVLIECLGAAAAISAPSVPKWTAGYADGNVGGLLDAILSPVGGFGKVLVVLLSLSVTAANVPSIYSIGIDIQTLIPPLAAIPRYVFSALATAVIIVLAIVGQHRFYSALYNFLDIIGYWIGAWVSAICVEHLYFRKGNFELYDIQSWNIPSQLPLGAAALGASALSFALVVPSMSQVWYTGPIARHTGDIGFEVAFAVTALLYVPLRHLEKRWRGI